jgi:hypothetical protein
MAGKVKLDGPGVQKMKTIDEALIHIQRLHGVVELYALTLKQNKPTTLYSSQIKRLLFPLVGLLKPQFGLVADQVAALGLSTSRGGSEQVKVRQLREGVASLRMALEIAIVRIKDNHAVKEEKPAAVPPSDR